MAQYPAYDPRSDPSRNKGAALRVAPGTSGYANSVAAYNNWLYTPFDRRDTATSTPSYTFPKSGPVAPGNYTTPYGNVSSTFPKWDLPTDTPTPTGMGGIPSLSGLSTSNPYPSIIDTAPKAIAPAGNDNVPTQPQNAQQRWEGGSQQNGNPLRPISPQRRFFWATGQIDAHATQAPADANRQPVTFNNEVPGHSGAQPGSSYNFPATGGHTDWSPW